MALASSKVEMSREMHFLFSTKAWPLETRTFLSRTIQELSLKLHVQRNFFVMSVFHDDKIRSWCLMHRWSFIGINLDYFNHKSEAEREFIISREISQIQYKEEWTAIISVVVSKCLQFILAFAFPAFANFSPMALGFSVVITILFSQNMFTFSPVGAIAEVISFIATSLFSRRCEIYADKKGISVCSVEAKRVAWKLLDNERICNIAYRNARNLCILQRCWRRACITFDGNYRFDLLHPSLRVRINYLKPYAPSLHLMERFFSQLQTKRCKILTGCILLNIFANIFVDRMLFGKKFSYQ